MNYQELPGHSRLWVYQANRDFLPEEVESIRKEGLDFVQNWSAHGADLKAALEVFHNRFIVLFLDEKEAAATGCSIDKSIHLMKKFEHDLNCTLLDRMEIAYREDGELRFMHLNEFRDALSNGTLSADTPVFNNLVADKATWEKSWESKVSESWHAQLLPA